MILIYLLLISIVLILIYYDFLSDYNYNFQTFCKDDFCARIMERESMETIFKLYIFYNNIINILPKDDIRYKKLIGRFNVKKGLFEVDPFNRKNYTSYTLNKNIIGMCMREKDENRRMHNLEILKFVFLHEVAHICTDSYEHNEEFWNNFKWLLSLVYKNKLMIPTDYGKEPKNYCGMIIDNNPFFNF
jgi:hypothetical protein